MRADKLPGVIDSARTRNPDDAHDRAARQPAAAWTAASVLRQAQLGQGRHLSAAAIFLSAHQVAEALIPVIVGLAMGRAIATGDGMSLLRWLLALGLVYGVLTSSMRYGFRANRRAVQGAEHDP